MRQTGRYIAVSLFAMTLAFGQISLAAGNYKRKEVADARFGTGDREKYLKSAYRIAESIERDVKGQSVAAQILQSRVVQYFENFGKREREPIFQNLIGLPGVGKSVTVSKLIELGFPIAHYDAQAYSKMTNDTFTSNLATRIYEAKRDGRPLIIIIEELDKVPEVFNGHKETSSPIIGTLNQILSDGVISSSGAVIDAHNVMVLTTMNFAPSEMELFTTEVLQEKKSYYDLTIADMDAFNTWIKQAPSARYKILSRLFRSNTVRRLAPFTVIMQPLLEPTYREIIDGVIKQAIKRNTAGANSGKRLSINIDPSIVDFLFRETVYPPSGAGETVLRADAIIDQLINYGLKSVDENDSNTIDRPRSVVIGFDPVTESATLTVTPFIYRHPNLEPMTSFSVAVAFDRASGLFLPPTHLARVKPTYAKANKGEAVEPPITQKQTIAFRYPKMKNQAKGLKEFLNGRIIGQESTSETIEDEMNKFLAMEPTTREPLFKVLSGFPGIGKSEVVKLTAQHLELPIIKVNMQSFVSDQPGVIESFIAAANSEIGRHQEAIRKANGKYIFLIEELDKVFEINPKDGALVNRPVMAVIKDLLNDGKYAMSDPKYQGGQAFSALDISSAYTFVTMNFSVDRFQFSADPRMTTIDDVIDAWKKLKGSVAGTKQLLGSMFLPETVSRIMSQFTIMKPLTANDYRAVIKLQADKVVDARLIDKQGRKVGKINIELSPRYRKYLFDETVIPSEGARSTVVRSQGLISTDLEKAISALPKSKFGAKPLSILLDYHPGKTSVVVRTKLDEVETKWSEILLSRKMALTFPRIDIQGRIPAKRLHVSAHELGHGYIAARLGLRIDQVVVVGSTPGAGGYVKYKGDRTSAVEIMAGIYSGVAARALERIVFSPEPRDPKSFMAITAGASMDISQASRALYNMLFELGFDPGGGTIDRNFVMNGSKYADVAPLPPQIADKMGRILRRMENETLEDLLAAHPASWYVEKSIGLARKGAMDETEFYKLIEYTHPGDNKETYGQTTEMYRHFAHVIKNRPGSLRKAQKQVRDLTTETVEQTVERYLGGFLEIIESELHAEPAKAPAPERSYVCREAFAA